MGMRESSAPRAGRWLRLALLLIVLAASLSSEGAAPGDLDAQINRLLVGKQFAFARWEADALLGKLAHVLVSPQRYMDEAARSDFFLDYLQLVQDIQATDWEIERTYTDPDVANPDEAAADGLGRLAELREAQSQRQLVAEAIVAEQVASVLLAEGFGALGQEFPPVSGHFTPLPLLLVVSPRHRIENVYSLTLDHGLNAAEWDTIEDRVDLAYDVSSLVTGIGGLSAYPAMLLESSSLNWVSEVMAHEWTHHYLMPRPLGWNYEASPETRTINETVASIVGKEIGRRMLARYYPELLPPEREPVAEETADQESEPPEPPAFDFRAEMRETRVRADELLAQGRIEEAEAYMEERRRTFVANGYGIRKLNQAYFAFYGAYADEPGARGEDPIGPAVQELRASSPNLHTFVTRAAGLTTLAELEDLLDRIAAESDGLPASKRALPERGQRRPPRQAGGPGGYAVPKGNAASGTTSLATYSIHRCSIRPASEPKAIAKRETASGAWDAPESSATTPSRPYSCSM